MPSKFGKILLIPMLLIIFISLNGKHIGLASVATLNFNTKDCELGDGTWIKLDCPDSRTSGSLWELDSFSDADGECSYEKPINVIRTVHMNVRIISHGILIGQICDSAMGSMSGRTTTTFGCQRQDVTHALGQWLTRSYIIKR